MSKSTSFCTTYFFLYYVIWLKCILWFAANSCLLSSVLFHLKPVLDKIFLNVLWVKSKPKSGWSFFKTFNISSTCMLLILHKDILWHLPLNVIQKDICEANIILTHTSEAKHNQILSTIYFSEFPQQSKHCSSLTVSEKDAYVANISLSTPLAHTHTHTLRIIEYYCYIYLQWVATKGKSLGRMELIRTGSKLCGCVHPLLQTLTIHYKVS